MFPPGPAAGAHRSVKAQAADHSISYPHIKIVRWAVNRKTLAVLAKYRVCDKYSSSSSSSSSSNPLNVMTSCHLLCICFFIKREQLQQQHLTIYGCYLFIYLWTFGSPSSHFFVCFSLWSTHHRCRQVFRWAVIGVPGGNEAIHAFMELSAPWHTSPEPPPPPPNPLPPHSLVYLPN